MSTNKQRINIAITAMGGQGGGVLADWIIGMAEHSGWVAQTTSVPGVAQRTGATIYYLELFKPVAGQSETPVLSLSPASGDVDLVIAAELMEAGRAIQRGFVTPDRTTLIASSHRAYAVSEKEALGNALSDPEVIHQAADEMAQRYLCFDMAALATQTGSVVSAVLFGALCGSRVLPFEREAFEQAVRNGGVGVDASLRAFAAGHDQALQGDGCTDLPQQAPQVYQWIYQGQDEGIRQLLARVEQAFPAELQASLTEGVRRLLDHTGLEYAKLYVQRMQQILALEQASQSAGEYALSQRVAARLAVWMAYEDTIRVAEIKTRSRRFQGLYEEVGIDAQQVSYFHEYLHPRIDEVAETLPAGLGRWVLKTGWASSLLNRLFAGPKTVSTQSLRGFVPLYLVARMRRWRHRTLRYALEQERIEQWLALLTELSRTDAPLALEVAQLPELIKGYGKTHARGLRNFSILCQAAKHLQGQTDSAAILLGLHRAALESEAGTELAAALREAGMDALAHELGHPNVQAQVVQVMEPQAVG